MSVNKVLLVGRLGSDPEVMYSASGSAIAKFSIATSERWKDKQGQQQERTEWHRITAFGKLAEICGQYLKKGSQVYVEGSIQTSKYTDKQGIERYSTDIIINQMQMLDSKNDNSNQSNSFDQRNSFDKAQSFDDSFDEVPF